MTKSGSFKTMAALVIVTAFLMSPIIAASQAESFLATRTLVYKGTIKASKTIFNVDDTNNLLSASINGYWVMTYSYAGRYISPFYGSRSVMYDARAKCYKKVYYEIQTDLYDPCHVVLYHFDATDVNGRLSFDVVGKGTRDDRRYPVYTPVTLKGTGFVENFRFFNSNTAYTGPVTVTMTLCRKLMEYSGEPHNSEGDVSNEIYNAILEDMDGRGWTDLAKVQQVPPQGQQKLLASDGAEGDYFGYSVSVNGDYAIAGTGTHVDDENESGSAYIFKRNGLAWTQQAKLTDPDSNAFDYFGYSVSISGDYAIVGAFRSDVGGVKCGSAYIYKRSGSSWTQQAKLTASDCNAYESFGYSVSIDGDYAIVGASGDDDYGPGSGSAYIFVREGSTWSQIAKLTASDGNTSDNFGNSVCIKGDLAIIGADLDDDKGTNSGSAYMFARDGQNWYEQAKLTATDGASSDYFGRSVSVSGDYAIVGATASDGSAYIFEWDGISWNPQAKLTPKYAAASDSFGHSVSIDGDVAVVGSPGDADAGAGTGSAYIFTRNGTTWGQQRKLTAYDGNEGDYFGCSVFISDNYIIAGACGDDDNGKESGSAYIFEY